MNRILEFDLFEVFELKRVENNQHDEQNIHRIQINKRDLFITCIFDKKDIGSLEFPIFFCMIKTSSKKDCLKMNRKTTFNKHK
jgi:hypothetical protein